MLVTKAQRNRRLNICKKCPHLGGLNRCAKCGCFMDLKTAFTFTSCPIGKWGKHIAKGKDLEDFKNLLKQRKFTTKEGQKIVAFYNEAFNATRKYTNCARCVKQMISELERYFNPELIELEYENSNAQPSTPNTETSQGSGEADTKKVRSQKKSPVKKGSRSTGNRKGSKRKLAGDKQE